MLRCYYVYQWKEKTSSWNNTSDTTFASSPTDVFWYTYTSKWISTQNIWRHNLSLLTNNIFSGWYKWWIQTLFITKKKFENYSLITESLAMKSIYWPCPMVKKWVNAMIKWCGERLILCHFLRLCANFDVLRKNQENVT
jgi:hypothetical protein